MTLVSLLTSIERSGMCLCTQTGTALRLHDWNIQWTIRKCPWTGIIDFSLTIFRCGPVAYPSSVQIEFLMELEFQNFYLISSVTQMLIIGTLLLYFSASLDFKFVFSPQSIASIGQCLRICGESMDIIGYIIYAFHNIYIVYFLVCLQRVC